MVAPEREYGKITFLETFGLFAFLFSLPLVQGWRLLLKPFSKIDAPNSWRRVKADAYYLWVTRLNTTQIQFVSKSTKTVFEKWALSAGIDFTIEPIEEGAQLLWATPRNRKRVIVYFHGGGYCLPSTDFSHPYWNHITELLNEKGKDASFAVLEYTLIPKAHFPTQLRQGAAAIKHLIASGYRAEDIYIGSDSAGSSIFLQALSHILHPLSDVPAFKLNGKIGGAILISPYASLGTTSPSFIENTPVDVMTIAFCDHLAEQILPGVPQSKRVYVEYAKAPEDWWNGVDKLVSRVLITSGACEIMRSDIDVFAKNFASALKDTTYITVPRGVHNEPYDAFYCVEPTPGDWPRLLADWLAENMD